MKKVGSIGAVTYTGISVLAAGLFLLSTISGQYTLIEHIGGTAWVFLLSMIILMPVITPLIQEEG